MLYFVFAFAFTFIGLQPIKSASDVYASESEFATNHLDISTIELSTPVTDLVLNGADLETPEQIAGAYSNHEHKTLIVGHSSTIFQNLKNVELNANIIYNDQQYVVTNIEEKEKSKIDMKEILSESEQETIILMTCSGEPIPNTNGDHTHRLIIMAEKI